MPIHPGTNQPDVAGHDPARRKAYVRRIAYRHAGCRGFGQLGIEFDAAIAGDAEQIGAWAGRIARPHAAFEHQAADRSPDLEPGQPGFRFLQLGPGRRQGRLCASRIEAPVGDGFARQDALVFQTHHARCLIPGLLRRNRLLGQCSAKLCDLGQEQTGIQHGQNLPGRYLCAFFCQHRAHPEAPDVKRDSGFLARQKASGCPQ